MSKQKIVHRGLDIKSPGHLRLCEALEELGLAYSIESPLVLPGDPLSSGKKYRKADLIVFNNDCHLFVEIDGETHNEPDQMVDDYKRDYYLFRSCGLLSLRFSHKYVLERPMTAAGLIWSSLSVREEDHILRMGGNWIEALKAHRDEETKQREKEWKRHERKRYPIGSKKESGLFYSPPDGASLLESRMECDDEIELKAFLEKTNNVGANRDENLKNIVNIMMITSPAIDKYISLSKGDGPSNESVIDFCEFITAGVVEGLDISDDILIEEIRRIALARTKARLMAEQRTLPSMLRN